MELRPLYPMIRPRLGHGSRTRRRAPRFVWCLFALALLWLPSAGQQAPLSGDASTFLDDDPRAASPPPPGQAPVPAPDSQDVGALSGAVLSGLEEPASVPDDVSLLGRLPVLHEGRLKPMETFARHTLLQLSGKSSYGDESALQVLGRMLFAPATVRDYRLFLINNPEVAQALGIESRQRRRYAFSDLEGALAKLQELAEKAAAAPEEERDLVQKEVLRVYSNVAFYFGLTNTMHYALPSPAYAVRLPETRTVLRLEGGREAYSFWDLMTHAPHIAAVLEGVGEEENRSELENEVIRLSQAMYISSQTARPSAFLVLPQAGADNPKEWTSPGEAIAVPERMQKFHAELQGFYDAARAYRSADQAGFNSAVAAVLESVENRAYDQLKGTHFPLEILYQKVSPFYRALAFYWLSVLACFAFFLTRRRWLYRGSLALLAAGFALNLAGIVARMVIMGRPPVSSLFETFPFVAAVGIAASLFIERLSRRGIGLVAAGLMGVILLHVAMRYASEGDTMKVLVAVLQSNFWLSTHVITINVGYAACGLASLIGHIWLFAALLPERPGKAERLREIHRMLSGSLGFGLLFAFFGTMLGGIWADQSWGRFWGWDPKENGALLIVIWVVILLHARVFGRIGPRGMALGSVFLGVVVALAWFGVNLLNVGLHSYGFTEGAGSKLFAYIGVETAYMAVTGIWLWLRPEKFKRAPAPAPGA